MTVIEQFTYRYYDINETLVAQHNLIESTVFFMFATGPCLLDLIAVYTGNVFYY